MKKTGAARTGERFGRLANGKFREYVYERQSFAPWELNKEDSFLIYNVNIVDVDKGELLNSRAVLIKGERIEKLYRYDEEASLKREVAADKYIDGKGNYLIPGLSDIHCHVGNISEYKMKMKDFYFHDAQRERNCENALQHGCTFVRNSGGAYDMVHAMKEEIEADRLLGPRIMPSYIALSPIGGMWDMGPMMNNMAPMMFGGEVLNFQEKESEIKKHLEKVYDMGAKSIKFYTEDKPLYGGKPDSVFNMFPDEIMKMIKDFADEKGVISETHSMYIKGSRKAIKAGIGNIAHMTVDESYSLEEAKQMAEKNVAIVPTLSIGCFLSMNFDDPVQDDEVVFYQDMMKKHVTRQIEEGIIPSMKHCSERYYDFVMNPIAKRKMPEVGMVHKDRCLGFAKRAPLSFANFKKAGTKIGMGTDGGTGLTFPGCLSVEFEGYSRYGMSPAEILRSATLTNMEIVGMDNDLGSLEEGKYADMVLLRKNPLKTINAINHIAKVFKNGRLYVDNER